MKIPSADLPAATGATAAAGGALEAPRGGTTPGTADGAQRNALPPDDPVAALFDRVDIHMLDVASALQILITEARVELGLPVGALPMPPMPLPPPQGAAQAAHQLVQMFLQALPPSPEHEEVEESPTPVLQPEATLRLAMDRAVEAVAAWREVSVPVVDAAKDTRALVVSLLNDEPPSPLWFQLEWLALAPRMQRYWRRRRRQQRRPALPRDMPGFREEGTK